MKLTIKITFGLILLPCLLCMATTAEAFKHEFDVEKGWMFYSEEADQVCMDTALNALQQMIADKNAMKHMVAQFEIFYHHNSGNSFLKQHVNGRMREDGIDAETKAKVVEILNKDWMQVTEDVSKNDVLKRTIRLSISKEGLVVSENDLSKTILPRSKYLSDPKKECQLNSGLLSGYSNHIPSMMSEELYGMILETLAPPKPELSPLVNPITASRQTKIAK